MPQEHPPEAPRESVGEQARVLLKLGLPLIGSHLAQLGIVTTDTIMMGWYGVNPLAALSLSGPIFFILFILGSGFAIALMPKIARALAKEDNQQIRRVTRMGIWLSVLYGLAVTPFFLLAGPLLAAAGQDPEVARLSGNYLSILGLSMVPALLVMVLRNYLTALELTRSILIYTLITIVLNAFINYALIFGNWGAPELGIEGAAIASVIGNLFMFAAFVVHSMRHRPEHQLFRNIHKPDWPAFWEVYRLGWPIGLTIMAESALFGATSFMMGWVGTVELAAHGIALQITSLTFMAHVGLSSAITVRTGATWGNASLERVRAIGFAGALLAFFFVAVTVAAFLGMPETLIDFYLDPEEPERAQILVFGTVFLAVAALFQLVDAAQIHGLGLLRGVQDTKVPMKIAIISYWGFGMPVAYFLGFHSRLEGAGIWLGLTLGLAIAAILLQHRFWTRYGSGRITPPASEANP